MFFSAVQEKTADLQCLFIVSHQSALFQWVHCIILYILISAGLSDLTDSFLPIEYSLFYPVKSGPSSSCLHPLHRQLHGCGTAVGQKRTSAAVSRAAIVSRIPKLQKNRLKTAKRRWRKGPGCDKLTLPLKGLFFYVQKWTIHPPTDSSHGCVRLEIQAFPLRGRQKNPFYQEVPIWGLKLP